METVDAALHRLEEAGFGASFRAVANGMLSLPSGERFAPEELYVVDLVRFEGESDPADEAVVYALSTGDGAIRGTFVVAYGPTVGAACAQVVQRLRSARTLQRGEPSAARSPRSRGEP